MGHCIARIHLIVTVLVRIIICINVTCASTRGVVLDLVPNAFAGTFVNSLSKLFEKSVRANYLRLLSVANSDTGNRIDFKF